MQPNSFVGSFADNQAILSSFVAVSRWVSVVPINVSPLRLVLPEGLPSSGITHFHRYYAPSDFLLAFLGSLSSRTCRPIRIPLRTSRISHVHFITLTTCHALSPRECYSRLPIAQTVMLLSAHLTASAILHIILNEARSLQLSLTAYCFPIYA